MLLPCSIYLTLTLQTMYKIINTDVRYSDQIVTNTSFLVKKTANFAHYIEQKPISCYKIVNKNIFHKIYNLKENQNKPLYFKQIKQNL
ncbi:hypothetical protein F2P58_10980 [Vibrio fortis]|uniref:Uncharacterized protein n=1 Tax=Vibrio fortis TaxID=212667 RepID=A0A5N3R2A6_9VIBR|nr:hypothetical protein F2P58_10980 [Vibrio fortis]